MTTISANSINNYLCLASVTMSNVALGKQVNNLRDLWACTTSKQLQEFQIWYHKRVAGDAGPPHLKLSALVTGVLSQWLGLP